VPEPNFVIDYILIVLLYSFASEEVMLHVRTLCHTFMDIQQGTAEVIFTRRSEAVQALKRYNNVRLDGKEMKIEVIGANLGLAAVSSPRVSVVPGARGRGQREVVMMYGSSL
jgi:hypothetical protein